MKIERSETDSLHSKITVRIEQSDYEQKYRSHLQEQRKKTNIKGFRKGKTPLGFIKKLYGKAILADVVNETLQQAVVNYLVEEKIDFLGQPLPSEDQKPIDFENEDNGEFEFVFDLGIAPDFELSTEEGKSFNKDKVEIPDKMVRDELELLQRRMGNQILAEEDIREKDILLLDAKELEGDSVKEGGHRHEFTVMVDLIADAKLKKEVLKKKVKDTIRFNIFKLEKDRDEQYVRKYFLGQEGEEQIDTGEMYEAEIKEVRRIEPAALDEEFFNRAFSGMDVHSESEALDAIRKDISTHYDKQADALLYKSIQEFLMDHHKMDFPDDFLRRWLKFNNEKIDEEELTENYPDFQRDLKWRLIKNKLGEKFQIKIEEEEIRQESLRRIKSYLGAYQDESLVQSLQQRILGDKQQVEKIAEEIEANKIYASLVEIYKIRDKKISLDDFREKLEKHTNKEE